nr:MAG: coat protein [Hangzhou sepedon violaceus nodavirus 1]UHR49759.1 MAG: coat protein [Hangzhou sepedon violaceus nodavirus 1]
MKICPICRSQFETKAALASHVEAVHQKRTTGAVPRTTTRSKTNKSGASITLSRSEYLGSFSQRNVKLQPGATGAKQLDAMAAVFELYRWEKITFRVTPTVGLTTGGQWFQGYSYEADHYPSTAVDIAYCQPSSSGPVSREGSLSCSPRLIMGQPWLPTMAKTGEGSSSNAGFWNLASDQQVGVWFSYTVTLTGPTSQSRVRDELYSYDIRTKRWSDNNNQLTNELPSFDGPADIDLELATGDPATIDQVVNSMAQWYTDFTEMHRRVVNGITFIHAFATSAARVAAFLLGAGAVVHHRPLLFRADPRLLDQRDTRPSGSDPCVGTTSDDAGGTTS